MIEGLENQTDLLERHVEVLERVVNDEPVGILTLSADTGHEFHEVRYSLRRLEEESIIEPTADGAILTDEAPGILTEQNTRLGATVAQLDDLKFSNTLEVE